MTNKVYVTGATGYVGKYLCKKLSELGMHTQPISLFRDGKLQRIDKRLQLDTDCTVIHLSENANSNASAVAKEELQIATENVRTLMKSSEHVIYFSSAAIYNPLAPVFHDEQSTKFSNTNYAQFKLRIENELRKEKDLILRPTNIYSKVVKRGTVLGDLVESYEKTGQAHLKNPSIELDFVNLEYISNLVSIAITNNVHGTVNCATGTLVSGKSLIEAIGGQPATHEPLSSPYDNHKFRTLLGLDRIPNILDEMKNGESICLT